MLSIFLFGTLVGFLMLVLLTSIMMFLFIMEGRD